MRTPPMLLLVSLLAVRCYAADSALTGGEAGALVIAEFCGKVVGESPDEIRRIAASLPGLELSEPMTVDRVPDSFRRLLSRNPRPADALFQTMSYVNVKPDTGRLLGLVRYDTTECFAMVLDSDGTHAALQMRLDRAASGWRVDPGNGVSTVYLRKARNGRELALRFFTANRTTASATHVEGTYADSIQSADVRDFAADATRACMRVVLEDAPFESPNYFWARGAAADDARDGAVAIWMRLKAPEAFASLERKGGFTTCTLTNDGMTSGHIAIRDALAQAFTARPGAQFTNPRGSYSDPKTGRTVRLRIEISGRILNAIFERTP